MWPKTGQKGWERLKNRVFLPIEPISNLETKMEIVPIPGIRALPVVKAPQGDYRPPEVFDIEGSARPGDGEGQRNGRKASGAEENDEDDLMLDAETESGGGAGDSSSRVDYFA
jgi:hypothetical protein